MTPAQKHRSRLLLGLAIPLLLAAAEYLYRAGRPMLWPLQSPGTGSFELYITGESTSLGEPYGADFSPAAVASGAFYGRIRGAAIKGLTLARHGETIYPQAMALERALLHRDRRNSGAVFIYSGHNDANIQGGPSWFETLKERLLYRSAMLRDGLYYAEKKGLIPRVRTPGSYEYHLRRMIEMSLESGLVPVIATVASNISDMDPGLFLTPQPSPASVSSVLAPGLELERSGSYRKAYAYYSDQAALNPPLRVYLEYRGARCSQALGRYDEAKAAYQKIVDASVRDNFGRASSRQNALIRALAKEYGIPLVDTVAVFELNSPHGLPGSGLFADGHHPNAEGYCLLGNAFAEALGKAFKEPVGRTCGSGAELRKELRCGDEWQGLALLSSGRWLFSAACGHAYPAYRLNMAREKFSRAAALMPGDFSPRLGLGLTEAALHGGLFSDKGSAERLKRLGLSYGGRYEITKDGLDEIITMLRRCGVPAGLLEGIMKSYKARDMERTVNG